MQARTYILRIILFILFAAVTVVFVNFMVDPYAITGASRVSGFNEYKIDINNRVRLMKKYNPLASQHNALIVGNSRIEMGISPDSQCFRDAGMTLYNLGIPGATVRQQLAYALNVIYQQPIRTVFLSLDFTDFIFTRRHARLEEISLLEHRGDGFRYDASGRENPEYVRTRALDYYQALFSLDSLVSSVKTVALQDAAAPDRDDAGFNPARDFGESVRVEGPRALFDQKMVDLREHFSVRWFLRGDDGRLDPAFEDLRQFLNFAVERELRVHLFINPFHAIYWDLLRERNYMPLNQEWLSEVKKLVGDYPPEVVSLWDFSGDSPYIHEEVPPASDRSGPLRWFWEPSHYREELGDRMVEAMLSDKCDTEVAFGRRLH